MNWALLIILIISLSEKDLIEHNPDKSFFPKWKWYVQNNWRTKSWWLKNVFTVFLDGWHFWKTVEILILSYWFVLLTGISYWWIIPIYAITGAYHSIRNGSLFRKNLQI